MSCCRGVVALLMALAVAGCGSDDVSSGGVPRGRAGTEQLPVSPSAGVTPDAQEQSDTAVVDRVAAACELLTSEAIVAQYAGLMGGEVEAVAPCMAVRNGARQLGLATTRGSGLVLEAQFTSVADGDRRRLTIAGFYLPWIAAINGGVEPDDMRAAFPRETVTEEASAAGHTYLLMQSSDDLRLDVAGLMLTFNRDVDETAPPTAAIESWPLILDRGRLVADVQPLVDAIVDGLAAGA